MTGKAVRNRSKSEDLPECIKLFKAFGNKSDRMPHFITAVFSIIFSNPEVSFYQQFNLLKDE